MQMYFHIGLYKTGTTFLQRRVFPKMDCLTLADLSDWTKNPFHLFQTDRPYDDAEIDATAARLVAFVNNAVAEAGSPEKVLWSWEGLTGNPNLGFLNQESIAKILHKAFPDAKILLTLRRQDGFLESFYTQAIHHYGWGSAEDFILRQDDGSFDNYRFAGRRSNSMIAVPDLDWGRLVDIYQQRFGVENMLVQPYEALQQDHQIFVERICDFMGVASPGPIEKALVNRSFSRHSFLIARLFNRFTAESGSPFPFLINRPFCDRLKPHIKTNQLARIAYGICRRLDIRYILQNYLDRLYWTPNRAFRPELKEEILAFHQENNRALDKKLGGILSPYGYY